MTKMTKGMLTVWALLALDPLAACDGTIPPPDSVSTTGQSNQPAVTDSQQEQESAANNADAGAPVDDMSTASVGTAEDDEATSNLETIATGAEVARSDTFGRIVGHWAETADGCTNSGGYRISASRVERPGRLCSVAELIDAGPDSVTAALLCPSAQESIEERELLRLSLQDGALNVNIVGSQAAPTALQRCPR